MISLKGLNTKFGYRYGEISNLSFKDIYDISMLRTDIEIKFRVRSLQEILRYKFDIEGQNPKNPYAYITYIELKLQELKLRYEEGLLGQLEGIKKYDINYNTDYELILEQLKLWYPIICNSIIDKCKKLEKCLEEDNE